MKFLKIIAALLLVLQASYAQNTNRLFVDLKEENTHVKVKVTDGTYLIKPYTEKIVELSFIPEQEAFINTSHAVVLAPISLKTTLVETEKAITYTIEKDLVVFIQKAPFQVSFNYKGKPVISEKLGYTKIAEREAIQFNIEKEEILYGGGARALGMNRRGHRLELYNKAHYGYETHSELMNYTMPLVLSSKIYAIHFDNAPIGFLDLDSKNDNTLTYETISGRKTYQVVVGDSWQDLITNYTALTGRQPIPPRWAFGNFASRFGYHSEEETRNTIQKFKQDSIPLDAVVLDLYWFGKEIQGSMGDLEFYKDYFPTPKKMIADFSKEGIETVVITEPFVLSTSKRFKDAVTKDILAKDTLGNAYTYDFYFGNTGLIDIYNPKGRKWFWNRYKELYKMGVTGFWGDLGEPEVHPKDLLHAIGTADEVHNIYGHHWAQLIQEGFKQDFPNKRPFILMRAGYSGSQRFGIIPWSGDVNRTWGGLQSQPEIALQMGMQGLGYMHSDLGGFAGDLDDTELYIRWLQYGVFQPIFRPHGQESVAPEPVFKDRKTKSLAKKAVELRYQLLPYNYTLAFENNQTGMPLMRSLLFEEPENKETQQISGTYLWGKDFLVSPIVKPAVTHKKVYFPKNNIWFNYYTNERQEGGSFKNIEVSKEYIPTYVRAGAFIPKIPIIQSTKQYTLDNLELHYYYDVSVKQSTRQLYYDNGELSNAYEKGMYELLTFTSEVGIKEIDITIQTKVGENTKVKSKNINLIIHNITKKPRKIKGCYYEWNKETKLLKINSKDEAFLYKKIKVKF